MPKSDLLSMRSQFISVCVALLASLLFLADVVFFERSLLPADYTDVLKDPDDNRPAKALWRIGNSLSLTYRRHDIGAGAWQFEPSLHFMTRVLWEGESPYWNPYVATGALGPETLADMKFSVVTLATAALGGGTNSFHFVFLVVVFLSSYSVLRLGGSFGLSSLAGFATLGAFLLGGYVQLNLIAPFLILIYFATPITLCALLALAREQSAAGLVLATLATLALFSLSFTPTLVLATVFIQVVCLTYILSSPSISRWRALALANVAAPLIAALILAPLYVPTVASFQDTTTLGYYLNRVSGGYPLTSTPNLLVTVGFQNVDLPSIGATSFVLAVVGLLGGRSFGAVRWALFLMCAAGLLVAFDIWPAAIVQALPIMKSIALGYWSYLYCIPIVFLVGFGVDAILRREPWGWLFVPGTIIVAIAFILDYFNAGVGAPGFKIWAFVGGAALFAGVVTAYAATLVPGLTKAAACALVLLFVVDGIYATNFVRPPRLDKGAHPPSPIAFVQDELGAPENGRALNVGRQSLYPDWADALGIAQVGTMNMSELRWFAQFFKRHIGDEWRFLSLGRNRSYVPRFNDAVLDLLGVRFVIVDKDQSGALKKIAKLGYSIASEDAIRAVYENPGYLPRAFIVGSLFKGSGPAKWKGGDDIPAATTTDKRLLRRAEELGVAGDLTAVSGQARITSYGNGRVHLEVELDRPGILVVTDAWHPGWSATVDNEPAHIGRVNMTFRGIALPAGRHTVAMTYRPRWFIESLVMAGVGGLMLVAIVAWLLRRPRVASPAAPSSSPKPAIAM